MELGSFSYRISMGVSGLVFSLKRFGLDGNRIVDLSEGRAESREDHRFKSSVELEADQRSMIDCFGRNTIERQSGWGGIGTKMNRV